MTEFRILAIAAASGRVGYVFLVGEQLMDWGTSDKASGTPTEAAGVAQEWINTLTPQVVVTERFGPDIPSHKGAKTREIIEAIARTASFNQLLDVQVPRVQRYANKYREAEALATRYPDISAWRPKDRRVWDNEPRNVVLFEALALAEEVRRGGAAKLAAAMG